MDTQLTLGNFTPRVYGNASIFSERERQLDLILSSLDEVSRAPEPVTVGLTEDGVSLITWLMDLGAAPNEFPVSKTLKLLGAGRPALMIILAPHVAAEMRSLVEKGAYRHRAGATDPSSVRIH